MTASPKLPTQLRELVRQRAVYLCEYCKTNERWQYVRFTIDHVVPLRAGGSDDFENLALACFHCNRRKSNRQTAIDPSTSEEVQLFNPRKDKWLDHFSWSSDGLEILATTTAGRATIELLEMNRARIIEIRRADIVVGRHPPRDIR